MPNTAKHEAIRKAYGKLFKVEKIDVNGWFDNRDEKVKFHHSKHLGDCEYKDNFFFRPKSLQGIENNNGWIRIDSEEDLPKASIEAHFMLINGDIEAGIFDLVSNTFQNVRREYFLLRQITHYQPIVKPAKPIY